LIVALGVSGSLARAQTEEKPRAKVSKEKEKEKESLVSISPEREAAVYTFVSLHHAELEQLLRQLREMNRRQYDRAMKELFATSERLAQLRDNDAGRYELELKAWQVRSRVQLLAAKLTMGPNEELQRALKAALAEQYDLRRQVVAYDRDRLRERMKKAEQDLADLEARRDAAIARQYEQLVGGALSGKARSEKSEKPKNSVVVPPASSSRTDSPAVGVDS
jgi:hypothetical protein